MYSNLINGYKSFYQKYFVSNNLYKDLGKPQSPKTLVIACSDSRIDPAIITQSKLGDIFVVRNIANLVPPLLKDDDNFYEIKAALEFAVLVLKVDNIIILGHSKCGGINNLLNSNLQDTLFIGKWINIAKEAKKRSLTKIDNSNFKKEDLNSVCEKESIIVSLENLMTFSWINDKVKRKKLKLHGWYFSIDDGLLYEYNSQKNIFNKIK